MILIGALCATALAAAAGAWFGVRRARGPSEEEPTPQAKPPPVRVFGVALGDVCIQRGYKEELATASSWTLRDEGVRAVIWLGTDKTTLFATRDKRWWMTRVDALAYRAPDVPSTIELQGCVLRRTRRLPVHVECAGDESFVADLAILGEYEDGTGKVGVLLASATGVAAFVGKSLREDELEIWDPAR